MPILPLLVALALAPADTVHLVLVATTDLHGHVTDWNYLQNASWPGGLARAATAVDSLRQRYPGQVLLVDAGDALQGSAFAAYYGREVTRDPHPVIEAMNLLSYDAVTPGDHDFDFGVAVFRHAFGGATFPVVSANLRAVPADTLAFPGYVVVVRNGVRVAITGLTTPAAMYAGGTRLEGKLRTDRLDAALAAQLGEMRKDADLTVVLAHSGLDGPSSYDTTGLGPEHAAARLAAEPLRPDLVVVGHSHQELVDSVIAGVHFVQPLPEGRSLAVVHIALLPRGGVLQPVRIRAERVALEDVVPSARITRRLADPHRALLGWIPQPLGEAAGRLSLAAARVEDTPLIRFVNEVQRRTAHADLASTPVPDLRAGLDAGEITQGELFRLYPSEQTLRAIRISGAQLKSYLEQCARYFYADSAGTVATNRYVPASSYDVVLGAQYTIDLSQPPGARITRLAVRGRDVTPADSFTLALGSTRQLGGGNFPMLAGARVVYDRGESIRGLLAAELRRRHTLAAEDFAGSDWSLAPADLAARARALFVREGTPAPVAVAPPPSDAGIPLAPTARERAAREAVLKVQDQARAAAGATAATLRLPAQPGNGRGLGRLLADAYRNVMRTDIAIVRADEAGDTLPAGAVTARQIAAAAPGRNRLLTIAVKGRDLEQVVEHVLETEKPCCELAGVRVEFDPEARSMDRVRRLRLLDGRAPDGKRTYLIAVSQALLEGDTLFTLGGTDCHGSTGCDTPGSLGRWPVTRSDRTASDVLAEYLRRLPQPVTPPDDPRLIPSR